MIRITRKDRLTVFFLPLIFMMLMGVSMVQADGPPWEQIHKLLAADGATMDNFGNSVAIRGNLALIGVPFDDDNGTNFGSAYIFDVTTGKQLFKLLAADGADDYFGTSVAMNGNLAVIGAPYNNDNGNDSGSAYVFDVTTGQQLFKLLAVDGAAGNQFGNSVSISGNLAVIGAHLDGDNGFESGSAYVFDVTTGQQLFKLLAEDGAASDTFGNSVAVSGNLAVIGARRDGDNGVSSGSAYVFDVTTGQQLFKLLATDGADRDNFGSSVAVSGNLAVIGVPLDDDNGDASGSAYVFDATTGQQLFKLLATDGAKSNNFGSSIAASGNLAVIGVVGGDGNVTASGSAYVFDITNGQKLFKLLATDGEIGDQFGNSVAISGNLVVIGALNDDDNGTNSGSAYVFQQRTTNVLTISPDPLIAQQDGTYTITQARPDQLTWLIYSLVGLQQQFIRQLNVVIDLANPQIAVAPRLTDANGDLQFILPMPGIVNPLDVWFQAVQQRNVTNFVATQLVQ